MSPPPVIRRPLLTTSIAAAAPLTQVHAAEITLAPGVASGRHSHAMDVVGCVTAGRIHFQPEGLPSRTLATGDAFHEPAGHVIAHFDNASDRDPATFLAFYLKTSDDQALIDMLSAD